MDFRNILTIIRILLSGLILFCSSAVGQGLNTAISYYNQGDFKSAQEELRSYLESNPSDYEALYYAGKLEGDAEKSVGYFKKVWKSSSKVKREESALELCWYYQTEGLNDSLLSLCSDFKNSFPRSSFLPQILWLESKTYLSTGRMDQALRGFKNIVDLYPLSFWSALAQMGMGEVYFSLGKFDKSIKEYNKVMDKYAETEAFPLTLAEIYRLFESSGDKNKAILYLNLYKEKFPEGIDSESQILTEDIVPEKKSGDAEKLTGTKYTVQIGVFSNKINAAKIMKELKSRGYKPEQNYKTIQTKKYSVIQVGAFDSLSEAQKLREKLEKEMGEVYNIVIK
jgi:tetratricopeptide (TPR) repeat protein